MFKVYRFLLLILTAWCFLTQTTSFAVDNQEAEEIFDNALQKYTGQTIEKFLEKTPIPFLEETDAQDTGLMTNDLYTYNDDIVIIGHEGIEMPANVCIPNPAATPMPRNGYPAVLLPHGFGSNEQGRHDQAKHFAENGYIVIRWTCRGFATLRNGAERKYNTGQINTIGPKDMADTDHVIDWLEENTPVDSANIGMTGISYGSIRSLNGVSQLDRVKTAAALDGPTNVLESFWAGETPHMIWMGGLLAGGLIKGNVAVDLPQNFATLLSYGLGQGIGIPELKDWAAVRSPLTYIDDLNASGKPVYINCLWHDNMFQAGQHFSYYEQLTVPKKFSVRNGTHSDVPQDVWEEVYDWMDYWLKGEENGTMNGDKVSMAIKNTGDIATYENWPAAEVSKKRYYLEWRGLFEKHGSLQTSQYKPRWSKTNTWNSPDMLETPFWDITKYETLVTTGIPVLSAKLDAADTFDVYAELPLTSKDRVIYYRTGKLSNGLKLRGGAKLKIYAKSSRPQAAYFVYLYDVNAVGLGTLITHGAFSDHEATANSYHWVNVDLVPAAWDIPPGHKLAVAIDTRDPLYSLPTLNDYSVTVKYSDTKHSYIELEVEN